MIAVGRGLVAAMFMKTVEWLRSTNWARVAVQVGLYLVGAYLAYQAVSMVWVFGEQLGASPEQKRMLADAHAAIHICGILFAFAVTMFLMDRYFWWSMLAIALMLTGGAYGITNITGCGSMNRIVVSEMARADDQRAWETHLIREKTLRERIERAEEVIIHVNDYAPAERNEARKLKKEYEKQLAELKAPSIANIKDGAAIAISRLSKIESDTTQAGLVTIFGALMYVFEVFAWIIGTKIGATAWAPLPAAASASMARNSADKSRTKAANEDRASSSAAAIRSDAAINGGTAPQCGAKSSGVPPRINSGSVAKSPRSSLMPKIIVAPQRSAVDGKTATQCGSSCATMPHSVERDLLSHPNSAIVTHSVPQPSRQMVVALATPAPDTRPPHAEPSSAQQRAVAELHRIERVWTSTVDHTRPLMTADELARRFARAS